MSGVVANSGIQKDEFKEKYFAVSPLYAGNHPKTMQDINTFIRNVPKAELHIHIEGSIEPELMFGIAERNKVPLPFKSTDEVRKAYKFSSLRSFLDVYYQGIGVLDKERDFYDITWAYLKTAHSQNVCHAEVFFDPQIHMNRGIPFETVMNGIRCAMLDAQGKMGISSKLILCFLRHLGVESAMETLRRAIPWKEWIAGVGLDSYEVGNPPEKFIPVFDRAREEGFWAVAHAGEEGPAEYIWQALEKLKVSRIDHGVRCVEDARLLEKLKVEQIPLTVCPLSNVKLHVFSAMEKHNLKQLLDLGLCVTVNSDDPAYFGGYITENFLAVHEALNLSHHDVYRLARNSFQASFLANEEKRRMLDKLDKFTFADNLLTPRCL